MPRRAMVAFVLCVVPASAPAQQAKARVQGEATYPVVAVLNARTVVVRKEDKLQHLRLIGVGTANAPQLNAAERREAEKQATEALRDALRDQSIKVVRDPACKPDLDEAIPVYAYRASDDLFVNQSLVSQGLVGVDSLSKGSKIPAFAKSQARARDASRGMWGGVVMPPKAAPKKPSEYQYEYFAAEKDLIDVGATFFLYRADGHPILIGSDVRSLEDVSLYQRQDDRPHMASMVEKRRAAELEVGTPVEVVARHPLGRTYGVQIRILRGDYKDELAWIDNDSLGERKRKVVEEPKDAASRRK